jgi:hypothetical protein
LLFFFFLKVEKENKIKEEAAGWVVAFSSSYK